MVLIVNKTSPFFTCNKKHYKNEKIQAKIVKTEKIPNKN